MSAAPVLSTARLELWRPQIGDLDDLFALTRDEAARQFLGTFEPSEMDSFQRLLRNAGSWSLWGYGTFMVRLRGEQRVIGNCGVFRSHRGFGVQFGLDNAAEAGWIIHPDHWGKGLAGEAMEAALAWFEAEHGHQRIGCMIDAGHAVSDGLARKLGFMPLARHRPEAGAELVIYARY